MNSDIDKYYLDMTLKLAKQGEFTVYPNPKVGAIIVKDNKIVGSGYHKSSGSLHAEAIAIKKAGSKTENSTLYVNLEPCSHFGKTPPCVDLIIKHKIKRVVIGNYDPNPLVNKKSINKLRRAGISVSTGVLKEKAILLNKEFYHMHQTRMPHVTVKVGLSLDGKISLSNGISKWITSAESRKDVQIERAKSSVILSTSKTILKDNPLLNVREPFYLKQLTKQPDLAIIDNKLTLDENLKIFNIPKRKILLFTQHNAKKNFGNNVEIIRLSKDNDFLRQVFDLLLERGHYKIFVESGSTLISHLLKKQLVNELLLYVSPKLLGHLSKSFSGIDNITELNDKINFKVHDILPIKNDLKIRLVK